MNDREAIIYYILKWERTISVGGKRGSQSSGDRIAAEDERCTSKRNYCAFRPGIDDELQIYFD